MTTKEAIINVFYMYDNKWMTSAEVYEEVEKIYKFGANKRGAIGHRNIINRNLSSRYTSIIEKDETSKPYKYRLKEDSQIVFKQSEQVDKMRNIENDEEDREELNNIKSMNIENGRELKWGLRSVDAESIAQYTPEDEEDDDEQDSSNTVDLSQGIKTRKARTKRHNEIVKEFAKFLEEAGLQLFEGRIDCLGIKNNNIGIILEIKTLNGSQKDEEKQVMLAIGQLYYYEKCAMHQYSRIKTQKVAVFENKITDEHIQLLNSLNILTIWKDEQGITGEIESLKILDDLIRKDDIV